MGCTLLGTFTEKQLILQKKKKNKKPSPLLNVTLKSLLRTLLTTNAKFLFESIMRQHSELKLFLSTILEKNNPQSRWSILSAIVSLHIYHLLNIRFTSPQLYIQSLIKK